MDHEDFTFLKEYTEETGFRHRVPQWLGVFMVLISIPLMLLELPFAFAVTALAWGAILVAMDQFYRYQLSRRKLDVRRVALELSRARLKVEQLSESTLEDVKLLSVGAHAGAPENSLEATIPRTSDE